jgi:hypothetical protein
MWRRLATVLFVAFFCEDVFCIFRVGPSSDSCSSNASEDDGEIKIEQNVWKSIIHTQKQKQNRKNSP